MVINGLKTRWTAKAWWAKGQKFKLNKKDGVTDELKGRKSRTICKDEGNDLCIQF